MFNFSLYILEYTDYDNLIVCEQKWIDILKPVYNLSPTAGSSKGYKHSAESVDKIRIATLGRTHTKEVKTCMSDNRIKEKNPFYGKKHSASTIEKLKNIASSRGYLPVSGFEVEITNLETKVTTVYSTIRKAASAIDTDIKTILRREKSQNEKAIHTPYRKKNILLP